MRPLSLEDAIRDVIVCQFGMLDCEDMVMAIGERIREGVILPIVREHGLPMPGEVRP